MSAISIGGRGGSPFSDFSYSGSNSHSAFKLDQRITGVAIRAGCFVDAIRLRYGQSWAPWHGGNGGKLYQFYFENTYIKKVVVYYDNLINAIKFVMSDDSTHGPYGRISGKCQVASFHSAEQGFLSYIKGSSGMLLDRIELCFVDFEEVRQAQSLIRQKREALEQQQQQRQQQLQHQQQQQHKQTENSSMEMPGEQKPEDLACAVCLDPSRPRNAVFLPCAHLQTCMSCALEIKNQAHNPVCPICRAPIENVVKVFM